MSKAILVVDIPKSCGSCEITNCRYYGSNFECREENCPLKEVPEKFEIYGMRYKGKYPVPSYRIGWNDCIDTILEESNE